MRYTKTPMQRRLAAEGSGRAPAPALTPPDAARRPLRASEDESDAALDAASAWLAHIQAGRIPVR